MLVTTHTIIASTIAVKTGNPWIYFPAALVNHFVFDAFPHFGLGKDKSPKTYFITAIFDAISGVSIFLYIITKFHFPVLYLFLVDLAAGWPDLVYLYHYLLNKNFLPRFNKFHLSLQNESKWGILIEIFIVGLCLYLLKH